MSIFIALAVLTPTAVASQGNWRTAVFAGDGDFTNSALNYNGEPAATVPIGMVHDLALAPDGDVYAVSEATVGGVTRDWIFRVDALGRVFTVAGGGTGWCESCAPTATDIRESYHLTVTPDGAVWYTEDDNGRHVVRRIDPSGATVQTIAGQFGSNAASDGDGGAASAAHVAGPRGIAAAADGSIYVADDGIDGAGPYSVRRISGSRVITRVAGTAGSSQRWQPETGPALTEDLTRMEDVEVDPADGSVWFAEAFRNVVRRISDPSSISPTLSVVAGLHDFDRDDHCEAPNPDDPRVVPPFFWNGTVPADGSSALTTTLCAPFGLSFDATGSRLYVADVDDRRIRRLDVAIGTISNVAGTGTAALYGYGGPAAAVTLHDDFAVLADGPRLLFADQTGDGNTRIVSIQNTPPVARVSSSDSAPVQFQPVALDATGSTDPDGGALRFDWDYGDGATGTTPGPDASHTFTTAGVRTVTVTATDDDGGTARAQVAVTVRPFQLPPIAAFAASMKRLANGRWRLTLDGSPSYDANGAITRWSWTFSDAKAGSGRLLTRSFAKLPKKLGVVLSVTDGTGLTSAKTEGTVLLPPVTAAKKTHVRDADGDSIPDARDHCPKARAAVDPDHDGCNGPFAVPHASLKHLGIQLAAVSMPFAVELTVLRVAGFAPGATAELVCDQGCGAENTVIGSATVAKNGTAQVDMHAQIVKAGSQLSVRALHRNWVSLRLPLLVRADATGASVAQAGDGQAACAITTTTTVSYVPCPQ